MDQYTQIRVLGKGSFGAAWLIQRKSDKVQLVAKEIRLAGLKPAEQESARKEIEVLRALDHPNITKYVDHFQHLGSLFIVMEYANGGDLHTKIKGRRGRLFSEKEVFHYFSQICLALGYLHKRHILHRDLKTQNVFLTKDGIVKLGDFGISTVLRNTYELRRTVCGTPYYFSPELCLNKPYNNKSDVWALGCILYEMTTLNHAFDGDNMKALVQCILKGTYPPISPSYSSNLEKLIQAMLQQDPHRRPNVGQIIELPLIRDALTALQHEVRVAREARRSVISEDERLRALNDARQCREEHKRREQQKAAQLEALHQEQRERRLNERRLELERAAARLQAGNQELDNRLREHQRLQRERKISAAERQRREEEWDRNMAAQAEAHRRSPEEDARRRGARPSPPPPGVSPTTAAAAAADYRERRRQAELYKRRAQGDLGLVPEPIGAAAPSPVGGSPPGRPPPPRAPPSPQHHGTKKMSSEELNDALAAAAYWEMRRETERNKRRAQGLQVEPVPVEVKEEREVEEVGPSVGDEGGAPPAPAVAAAASSPRDGGGNTDGDEGFHAFINGEAVVEGDAEEAEKREDDYGALVTYISQALSVHTMHNPDEDDFDDTALRDIKDPTEFMLDGKAFELPNVTASDPLMHRIEVLRMYLEEGMGDDALLKCYRALNNISTHSDERLQKVTESLPADKHRFIPHVVHLIVCEDAFNRQSREGR